MGPIARHSLHLMKNDQGFRGKGDGERSSVVGQPSEFKALCLQLQGDLAEYCHRFGFTSWASHSARCILCNACKAEVYTSVQTEDGAFHANETHTHILPYLESNC
eukprot:1792949-Amphidinium_carterae.1